VRNRSNKISVGGGSKIMISRGDKSSINSGIENQKDIAVAR
jgi:hypothetical protein